MIAIVDFAASSFVSRPATSIRQPIAPQKTDLTGRSRETQWDWKLR